MARHRCALDWGSINILKEGVTNLQHRYEAALLKKPVISHTDLVCLFTPLHHQPFMFEAMSVAAIDNWYRDKEIKYTVHDIALTFSMNDVDEHAPLLPRRAVLQPNYKPELQEEILAWAHKRKQMGKDFGRVFAVLGSLNALCSSPLQINYVWPVVQSLAKMSDSSLSAEIMATFENYRQPGKIPTLSHGLRQAARQAATTITGAMLLEEIDPDAKAIEPKVDIEISEQPAYREGEFCWTGV